MLQIIFINVPFFNNPYFSMSNVFSYIQFSLSRITIRPKNSNLLFIDFEIDLYIQIMNYITSYNYPLVIDIFHHSHFAR